MAEKKQFVYSVDKNFGYKPNMQRIGLKDDPSEEKKDSSLHRKVLKISQFIKQNKK